MSATAPRLGLINNTGTQPVSSLPMCLVMCQGVCRVICYIFVTVWRFMSQ